MIFLCCSCKLGFLPCIQLLLFRFSISLNFTKGCWYHTQNKKRPSLSVLMGASVLRCCGAKNLTVEVSFLDILGFIFSCLKLVWILIGFSSKNRPPCITETAWSYFESYAEHTNSLRAQFAVFYVKTSETCSFHYHPYLLSVVLNEHVYFVPAMPCMLLVLYCPVCGWKYEEKLRNLLVFASSTCTTLERKSRLVLWETVMCCGLGLSSSESTTGHNASCRGLFFLIYLFIFYIYTVLWSSVWTVLIELGSRVLISNCVSDFLPFVSYFPVK